MVKIKKNGLIYLKNNKLIYFKNKIYQIYI